MKINSKNIISVIVLLMVLVPFIYISRYTNPVADDFSYAHSGKVLDLKTNIVNEYVNWSGRYMANVLQFCNPVSFDFYTGYKLFPGIIILLLITSIFLFLKTIIGKSLKINVILQISILLLLLYIYQMPIISEGIYWYAGSIVYQTGNILTLIYLALMYMFFNQRYILKSKLLHVAVIIIVLFLLIGFNEIHIIMVFSFTLVLLFVGLRQSFSDKYYIVGFLVVAIIFSLIVFLSPGRFAREGLFIDNHNIIKSFLYSVAQTARFFLEWISSAPLWILSGLYYFVNRELSEKNKLFSASFYLKPWLSILLLLYVIFAAAFPPYWATGILGQHRTMNVAYFIFIILWFVNLTVWFNKYKDIIPVGIKLSPTIKYLAIIIVLCSFLMSKNGYSVMTDLLSGRAKDFDAQMTERYIAFDTDKDTIYLNPLKDPPKSLFVLDIRENPEHWINRCYAIYFDSNGKAVIPYKSK